MDLFELLATFASLSVLTIPIVKGLGDAIGIVARWRPVLSIGVGLGLAFVYAAYVGDLSVPATILGGLGVGVGATGLHSGTKNAIGS